MRGHGAYEALAGAILLGEATPAERATYAGHAAGCPRCARDIEATGSLLTSTFAAARHSETWRPFVRDDVDARIERRRVLGTRRVATLLSAAVAATLAFNVALAIGVHPRAREVALPASPPAAAMALRPTIALPPHASLAPHASRPRAVRTRHVRAEPALQVDPSAQAPDAASGAAPATLVTLPISFELDQRGRR